jgi:beta-lactamase class A
MLSADTGLRFVAALLLPVTLAAADPELASLQTRVQRQIAESPGHVSFFARNLTTGMSYGFHESDPVRTASTIKLPIMVECFFEAHERKLNWDEPVALTREEKVSGSGVLTEFTDGDRFPIRDLMHLMIVVSDNTATNLILNRIGGDAVNARMESLGLHQTRNMRKILGDRSDLKPEPSGVTQQGAKLENKKWGIGRSTPREMVTILEMLYRGELVDSEASKEMIAVLKRQQDRGGIARTFKDITVANKSGALDHLRSDVGIVYSEKGPIAMAITVEDLPEINWTPDNPGELTIAALSRILIEGLAKP